MAMNPSIPTGLRVRIELADIEGDTEAREACLRRVLEQLREIAKEASAKVGGVIFLESEVENTEVVVAEVVGDDQPIADMALVDDKEGGVWIGRLKQREQEVGTGVSLEVYGSGQVIETKNFLFRLKDSEPETGSPFAQGTDMAQGDSPFASEGSSPFREEKKRGALLGGLRGLLSYDLLRLFGGGSRG
jgi:hypothetical protein|tara:strand:- start:380 stop:946 length:567 start_codon:yes stop_codon:yes gene_type:complete